MFIIHNFVHDKNVIKGLYVLVIIALCASCVFYAVKYTQIKHFEDERNSFIISQIESGNKTVYLPHFPKELESYTEGTTPRLFRWYGIWENRYKEFYNIDNDISVQPISYNAYRHIVKSKWFYVRYGLTIPIKNQAILITDRFVPTVGDAPVMVPETTLTETVDVVFAGT